MNPVDQSIREIMGTIFQVHPDSIDVSTSPDTIESWDSLQHLNLILALEEHFRVQFTLEEVEALDSYTSIVNLVSRRLNHHAAR